MSEMSDIMRWREQSGNPSFSRRERLELRHRMMRVIRAYFEDEGFLEAETPLLVKATCPDVYIDSFRAGDGYLVTSTEYQIKRMIAGGFDKVFTLTRNFRENEQGHRHSSEFTMLEWGRKGAQLSQIEKDVRTLIQSAFSSLYPGSQTLLWQDCKIQMFGEWEILSVEDALKLHLGMQHLQDFSLQAMVNAAEKAHFALPIGFENDRDLTLTFLLNSLQSHLGMKVPTFLHEWPSYMTSSATSERSELYIGGVEVSNGFPFLCDAQLQRSYFNRENDRRRTIGKEEVLLDEKYLRCLEDGLPQGAGMALGIDRLAMLLTGASTLVEVQCFSGEEL